MTESLKGKLSVSVQKGIGLRRALIVFQFTVAIFVFVGALIEYKSRFRR